MDERFDKIEARLERIEGQLDENTQLIRGLMHNVETLGVEVDGLKVTTLTKESIAHLATKEDIVAIANVQQLHTEWLRKLAADSSQHEVEIHMLKQVK
ncbi:hypothetical protein Ga0466249_000161 [Sporomusaceae bacterium BoRhaA]|uniref:hypothetical protein n=1 Tax=Pelorhabdus rhamnosifermentans TaxID=2772457 RepID=UPI001C0627A7|nr:hypothetical protein [Pelorhabdus rhamnosifermentans]MBU2699082.1 hypothetical protein [Pelorhabdus rhamnosifermentans]